MFGLFYKYGTDYVKDQIRENQSKTEDADKKTYFSAMLIALDALEVLAERYADLAIPYADCIF